MKPATNPTALRVQAFLGPAFQVLEFEAETRTAADAAAAIGCQVAQIAKSLVFRTAVTKRPVLVAASGPNRVDEKTVADIVGEKIERADAGFVREKTGFSIGGIPPVCHVEPPVTVLDQDLRAFETIWAAAGTPHAVFALSPDQLAALTGAGFHRIVKG